MNQEDDIESAFLRARDGYDVEARDRVLTAIQQQLEQRIGSLGNKDPHDYISKTYIKLLEDWVHHGPGERAMWARSSFGEFLNYVDKMSRNAWRDSERRDDMRKRHETGIARRRDAQESQKQKADKADAVVAYVRELARRGKITDKEYRVWLARYTQAKPDRETIARKEGLKNKDEVTQIVGKVNELIRRGFPGWGDGGDTIKTS